MSTVVFELLPPLTLLTALGVWYGYELTLARARYFGLDPSVLDYTTSDLLMRTAPAVLGPLMHLMLALLVLISLHVVVRWFLQHRGWAFGIRLAAGFTAIMGVLLIVEGVLILGDHTHLEGYPALRPLVLPFGIGLVFYAIWVVRKTSSNNGGSAQSLPKGTAGLVTGITLLSLFWSFSEAAEHSGARDSYLMYISSFGDLPRVVVYSNTALVFEAPGVTETPVGGNRSVYHWRYEGLRLLVHSADKYFLLPTGWASSDHSAIVLPESPNLRFEFKESERYQP